MKYVYVLDQEGKPLMPTCRYGKVRRMLQSGQAKVVSTIPFTIQLTYKPKTYVLQQVVVGCDPGRTNIGLAAVREDGTCLYRAHCTTRNKEIGKLMSDRLEHRRASRRGERLARKRLAKKLGTTAKKLRTHLNLFGKIQKILPVTDVVTELKRFAFMQLDQPGIHKWSIDFQHGPLYGMDGLHAAIQEQQQGRCLLCGKKEIEHFHHIIPRSKYGSDTIANIAGLCEKCHELVHKNADAAEKLNECKSGLEKKYGGTSVLNQIIPALMQEFSERFPNHAYATTEWQTKQFREGHTLEKDHDVDAYCIAASILKSVKLNISADSYEIQQFRKHNRANIHHQTERTYKLHGKIVAKNRHKRMEQKTDSLQDWYEDMATKYGEAQAKILRSKLTVQKSTRYYNSKERLLPGTIFSYDGGRYVLTGQLTGGAYYRAYGEKKTNFPAKQVSILCRNEGLVYVG